MPDAQLKTCAAIYDVYDASWISQGMYMYPVKILEPLLSDSLCARDVEQADSEGCAGQFLELAQCSAYSLTRILTKNGVMRWPYSILMTAFPFIFCLVFGATTPTVGGPTCHGNHDLLLL